MATEIDLVRDSTMQTIAGHLEVLAAAAEVELAGEVGGLTWEQVQKIVKAGYASDVFAVGDQLTTTWTDTLTGTTYSCPFDIVAFQDVTLEDGESVPGMILEQHYAMKYSMPFDSSEAFYCAEEALAAGTYYITYSDTDYSFTLTEELAAGGVLALESDELPSEGGTVYALSSASSSRDDAVETCTITAATSGTYLGTLNTSGSDGLNSSQKVRYGSNRWSTSALRQYLNSAEDAGSWWTSQHEYDLQPSAASSYPGLLSGFEDEFLAVLSPVAVYTRVEESGAYLEEPETTYDTFFAPSLEEMYYKPHDDGSDNIGGEGEYWPYWKLISGEESPESLGSTNSSRRTYLISSTSGSVSVWLRSASFSNACNTWDLSYSGGVGNVQAYNSLKCAPACCIC